MNKTTAQNALNAMKLYVEAGHGNSKCTDAQGMACIKAVESIAELEAVIAQPVEPFGYWFNREKRFATLDECDRYFNDEEKKDLLIPLFSSPQEPAAPASVEQAGEIKGWGVIYNTGSGTYKVRIDEPDSDHANVGFKEPLFAAPAPVNAELLEAMKEISGLSAGWDVHGSTGPIRNYSWETVARLAMDYSRAAIKKAEGAA